MPTPKQWKLLPFVFIFVEIDFIATYLINAPPNVDVDVDVDVGVDVDVDVKHSWRETKNMVQTEWLAFFTTQLFGETKKKETEDLAN